MIEGIVNASREAVVPLTVASPAGRTQPIDAVIDTGFSGFLTARGAGLGTTAALRDSWPRNAGQRQRGLL